jgi:hypothetical protein
MGLEIRGYTRAQIEEMVEAWPHGLDQPRPAVELGPEPEEAADTEPDSVAPKR